MIKLNSLEIKNVKGLSNCSFTFNFFPNKPCVLVAPNGFGKSSLACAFKSLKSNKLDLKDDDFHNGDLSLLPELTVELNNVKYLADTNQNEIYGNFDYFVINNPIVAKAKQMKMGGFTRATASITVDTIELVATIPEKVMFDYSIKDNRAWFGSNGKILSNIGDALVNNDDFIYLLSKKIDFSKFDEKRNYINPVKLIVEEINNLEGTSDEIKDEIKKSTLSSLELIEPLKILCLLIKDFTGDSIVDCYLHSLQLVRMIQGQAFKKALTYKVYCRDKAFFDDLLCSVNSTRHNLKAKEVKKSKSSNKKKLVVEFPKINSISNGQRDIISFISQIQKAKSSFKKQNCILIVDEIFDYLDDANLVSFQYYITKLIEEFKSQGRNIYPILLTHLDPQYFNHFCFNKHKMQIHYLARSPHKVSSKFLDIVKNRKDQQIESDLSKYFFHYHPEDKDLENDFVRLNMPKVWGKSLSFHAQVALELDKYLRGSSYDPIAVLFAVRVKVEKLAYNSLLDIDKEKFLDTHKTRSKLEFCEEKGVPIPEISYLLGLIYNDDLHWRNNRDYITPLVSKLENMTVKKMISELK
ncbi:hypothetical protein L3I75_004623 [Vibrio vulnificus]|nr:hypothetical protein [Vibrio vulnificus]EIU7615486.1 hypothetical protein [Vibrio vulnificus]EIU7865396.1 hypothetical protein [Vibrio vulnificus]